MAHRPSWTLLCLEEDRDEEWDSGCLGRHVPRLGPCWRGAKYTHRERDTETETEKREIGVESRLGDSGSGIKLGVAF